MRLAPLNEHAQRTQPSAQCVIVAESACDKRERATHDHALVGCAARQTALKHFVQGARICNNQKNATTTKNVSSELSIIRHAHFAVFHTC